MTWEIVVGLITLIGAVISIATVISNNTKAMTELKCSIDNMKTELSEQKSDVAAIKDEVNNHETRITVLEKK